MNRKEFFKTGGRFLILGAMAATTGYLVVNQKVDATCSVSTTCRKCSRLAQCGLPQAVDTKQTGQQFEKAEEEFNKKSPEFIPGV